MRLLLAAPALRLQLTCSGPLYLSRRSLCPRSHAWPRVTGRWQRVYEHLRSAICCSPSPAVVKIHCVSRVLGLHISRRQAGRRTPRHNQRRPAQPQAPRTRRHDRPHARLAPGDDRRMEREASRSGRRRRQTTQARGLARVECPKRSQALSSSAPNPCGWICECPRRAHLLGLSH